jgi:hypothetical protein
MRRRGVAQIFNLPYRRFLIGRVPEVEVMPQTGLSSEGVRSVALRPDTKYNSAMRQSSTLRYDFISGRRLLAGQDWILTVLLLLFAVGFNLGAAPRQISGIYPHLAMLNNENECGTGAVVPWTGRLWAVTYAPHAPTGSSDKLYEITSDLHQIIRPESIGGTPANRFIHRESEQLFIGPYAIRRDGTVRAIPYANMFGRPTGVARHLHDPANKVVYATMEEGFYEVSVDTLAVKELWADEQQKTGLKANLPGYHGKGFYSAQGRYVYANNGDHAREAMRDPSVPSGALAEWDGRADSWAIVRRNQFTEVTGPGGIYGNDSGGDRLWTIGWDHRSLILMLLQDGKWHSYRLPKASHCYDGAHGWNTEWPRIRDIGGKDLLMTMHGGFWSFPKTFSTENSAGIAPLSTYLKVIGDFCRWDSQLVFGCDDTARSEFINKSKLKGNLAPPGRSQSNLWFVDPSALDDFGPALGRSGVWLNDDVSAGSPSEPFLFSGYDERSLFLTHKTGESVQFLLEVDREGNRRWTTLRVIHVPAASGAWTAFKASERGAWIRLTPMQNITSASAFFHYRKRDDRTMRPGKIFSGLSDSKTTHASGGLLHVGSGEPSCLRFLARNESGDLGLYLLDPDLRLRPSHDPGVTAWMRTNVAVATDVIQADRASVIYTDEAGRRWRLPRNEEFEDAGLLGSERVCREVVTERNLLNVHGTFYELPAENAGGFPKIRPIATHNRHLTDFASYRGLLVISGIQTTARGDHIIRSEDGKCALWAGAVDDLWQLGKPRGRGGPWRNTIVRSGEPSDPYLIAGYDKKCFIISHNSPGPVRVRIEAEISGEGTWVAYRDISVQPGKKFTHSFPDAFGAYWVRLVSDKDTTATAEFIYE